ncbi:cadherin repeat domain-containing protein, partial [Ruegeria sp. SCP11]|uniref:cadherin repeat domain-containing protein n=1 Tax=Ruegeria sp. SCP11 TaxID=3141378 RepID=UPI00333BD710
PTDITLSNASVDENAAGAIIGDLTVTDPDDGDSHTFSVDDARFEVVAGQLKLKAGEALDHETEDTVNVEVTAEDTGSLTYSETFVITVNDLNEAPTDITLSNASVDENAAGAIIGDLTVTDP